MTVAQPREFDHALADFLARQSARGKSGGRPE
jgi:hypothetical protein